MKKIASLGSLFVVVLAVMVMFKISRPVAFGDPGHCGQRVYPQSRSCQEQERQILNATVRIVLESWVVKPGEAGYDIDYSMGHGTVMAGRYLITHNHFSLPVNQLDAAGDSDSYIIVYLYDGWGQPLYKGPFSDFELVWADEEILVFAHRDDGFFEKLGIASAEVQTWDSVPLVAGMTVAQIDWDGARTRVDWVTVQEVIVADGTPRLVLADGARPGASGGGIFWNGVHVANNWHVVETIGAAGEVVGAVTSGALNSVQVLPGTS